jgi:hypothetical protein
MRLQARAICFGGSGCPDQGITQTSRTDAEGIAPTSTVMAAKKPKLKVPIGYSSSLEVLKRGQ